jgi:hypothetical protein
MHVKNLNLAYDWLFVKTCQIDLKNIQGLKSLLHLSGYNPRANGAERRARVQISPGYLPPGKGKH